ncbi:hypothetical protein PROFUN_10685 [Planoprotostelium fungivorum]|uniref:Uncharacterized protein n=1 Tax=Planoprotostelium fungivorum TaxID=1890364 RepID=A0A2P6MUZ1_9EUKA|nr:hypothetical protein PROFUN_10685 [Planoprotostelium fungivorum]
MRDPVEQQQCILRRYREEHEGTNKKNTEKHEGRRQNNKFRVPKETPKEDIDITCERPKENTDRNYLRVWTVIIQSGMTTKMDKTLEMREKKIHIRLITETGTNKGFFKQR